MTDGWTNETRAEYAVVELDKAVRHLEEHDPNYLLPNLEILLAAADRLAVLMPESLVIKLRAKRQ